MKLCDDYPDDEDLQRVRKWDAMKDPKGLIDFICSIWHWGSDFYELVEAEDKWLFELHTGGWSGNEEIIEALMENGNPPRVGFWFFYWMKSERGGHYWFQISRSTI